MSDVDDSVEVPANRFTPDALRRKELLRAVAEDLDDVDPAALTPMEVRLARHTSVAALEKAAVIAEAVPGFAQMLDAAELREVIAFELAYGGVRDEANALARRIDHAILRRKLRAVKAVRALYKIAKGYVTLDAGDAVRLNVDGLKHTLVRPARRRRKKKGEQPEP